MKYVCRAHLRYYPDAFLSTSPPLQKDEILKLQVLQLKKVFYGTPCAVRAVACGN